ncbi:MAG: hypothetical protein WDN75_03460 [Bacteroidota bacterium]
MRLDYGSNLAAAPTIVTYPVDQFDFSPYRLWMEKEGDYLYGLVSNLGGGIASVDIGLVVANPAPVVTNYGDLDGNLKASWSIYAVKKNDQWTAFTFAGNTGDLYQLTFFNNSCASNTKYSTTQNPGLISYSTSGLKYPCSPLHIQMVLLKASLFR